MSAIQQMMMWYWNIPLDPNLIAWYKLDGNANDSAGSNNGTPTAITYTTGRVWDAASFNGTSSSIYCGSGALNITWTSLSVGFLINPNTTMVNKWIIFKWSTAASQWVYSIWFYNWSSMRILCRLNGSATEWSWQLSSTTTLSTGTWYYIQVTYDWTNIKIYINWVLNVSNSYSTALASNTDDLILWLYYNTSASYRYNWLLDEVKIYDRVLTAWEITAQATAYWF